jgi:2-keto-4-pentenoate hydratase/2-oxohepta-3-ene-1,7-dioic acid hydratase in catechol pathway
MKLTRTPRGVYIERPGQPPLPLAYIMGIGMNYAAHALEQGKGVPERPVVFTKNPAALSLHADEIIVPKVCQDRPQVDFEAELAVILGENPAGGLIRDVPLDRALSCVLAYTAANDVSARWWQKDGSGGQFCRGKSFDTFCPLGPRLVPAGEIPDPQNLRVRCRVNGALMQDASTSDMIFPVATLIHELSKGTTLLPGTVILTGTPSGVGFARTPPVFLKPDDRVEVEIERVGTLTNTVRFE